MAQLPRKTQMTKRKKKKKVKMLIQKLELRVEEWQMPEAYD